MTGSKIVPSLAVAVLASMVGCTPATTQEGVQLFADACAGCHTPTGDERSPGLALLRQLSPRAIVASLEDGVMRAEGAELTREQRVRVAEYLSGRAYTREVLPESAFCSARGWTSIDPGAVSWMGFGGNLAGTGFQSAERAGLGAADVPRLELRWAFAFPDAGQVRTTPTVAGDAVLVSGPFGEVFTLDAATGCVRWSFEADAPVRGAILVGEGPEGRSTAWFVDSRTSAYALDLASGSMQWKYRVGWHATSYGTGSPALYGGRPGRSDPMCPALGAVLQQQKIPRLGKHKGRVLHCCPLFGGPGRDLVGALLVHDHAHCVPVDLGRRFDDGDHQLARVGHRGEGRRIVGGAPHEDEDRNAAQVVRFHGLQSYPRRIGTAPAHGRQPRGNRLPSTSCGSNPNRKTA